MFSLEDDFRLSREMVSCKVPWSTAPFEDFAFGSTRAE